MGLQALDVGLQMRFLRRDQVPGAIHLHRARGLPASPWQGQRQRQLPGLAQAAQLPGRGPRECNRQGRLACHAHQRQAPGIPGAGLGIGQRDVYRQIGRAALGTQRGGLHRHRPRQGRLGQRRPQHRQVQAVGLHRQSGQGPGGKGGHFARHGQALRPFGALAQLNLPIRNQLLQGPLQAQLRITDVDAAGACGSALGIQAQVEDHGLARAQGRLTVQLPAMHRQLFQRHLVLVRRAHGLLQENTSVQVLQNLGFQQIAAKRPHGDRLQTHRHRQVKVRGGRSRRFGRGRGHPMQMDAARLQGINSHPHPPGHRAIVAKTQSLPVRLQQHQA